MNTILERTNTFLNPGLGTANNPLYLCSSKKLLILFNSNQRTRKHCKIKKITCTGMSWRENICFSIFFFSCLYTVSVVQILKKGGGSFKDRERHFFSGSTTKGFCLDFFCLSLRFFYHPPPPLSVSTSKRVRQKNYFLAVMSAIDPPPAPSTF